MKRLVAGMLASFAAFGLAGCDKSHSWNQKLVVSVTTPTGEKKGSSVTNVNVIIGRQPLSSTIQQFSVRGEATVVEVSKGKLVFALFNSYSSSLTSPAYLAEYTLGKTIKFEASLPEEDFLNAKFEAITKFTGQVQVAQENFPLFVTFSNIDDPKTVKIIDPKNFEASFGSGYSLKSVTLELTQESITTGIVENAISWLEDDVKLSLFWKSLLADGLKPNGSVGIKDFFVRSQ
jgi:hypothetical protein